MAEWETAGKVRMTPKGVWSSGTAYSILDVVSNSDKSTVYIAKKDVPAGIVLTNTEYWVPTIDVSEYGADGTVHYDTTQSLTDAQKTQARTNIGAGSASDVSGIQSAFKAKKTDTNSSIIAIDEYKVLPIDGFNGYVRATQYQDISPGDVLPSGATGRVTEYEELAGAKCVKCYSKAGSNCAVIAFYDASGTYISGSSLPGSDNTKYIWYTAKVPSSARSVRFSGAAASGQNTDNMVGFILEKDFTDTSFKRVLSSEDAQNEILLKLGNECYESVKGIYGYIRATEYSGVMPGEILFTTSPTCVFSNMIKLKGAKRVYCKASGNTNCGVIAFYDGNFNYINNSVVPGVSNTYYTLYSSDIPSGAVYVRFSSTFTDGMTDEMVGYIVGDNMLGYVGQLDVGFTTAGTAKNTRIELRKGENYIIKTTSKTGNGNVMAYLGDHSSNYVSIWDLGVVYLTPVDNGILYLYNPSFTGNISIEVYCLGGLEERLITTPTIYRVGHNRGLNNLTELLLTLKGDASNKIIYIDSGEYDIFEEYSELGLLSGNPPQNPGSGFYNYVVFIPENTHIIGNGLVKLVWNPDSSDISIPWSQTVSPINIAGSMTLENVEIHCKNGRYCIHDDALGKNHFTGAIKKFKNVRCYKYTNDEGYGFNPALGFGFDASMYYEFENCQFICDANQTCFFAHNRSTLENGNTIDASLSCNIFMNNCLIIAGTRSMKLVNQVSTSSQHIEVEMRNCYFEGEIFISDDESTGNNPNTYDLMLLNCGTPQITIMSQTNPYPVRQYPSQHT